MPYAAKAIITHEFDVDRLDIRIEFDHPMDIRFKPLLAVWLIELDSVLTAVDATAWLDTYTFLLTIDNVAALPSKVTVEYDGPSSLLTTVWGKQWEPWAAITSLEGWPTTFKYGMIILWHGSVATIPSGWHLCDGTEGTPDLRNNFIVGAGDTYDPDDTGGSLTHQHGASQLPHTHTLLLVGGIGYGSGVQNMTSSAQPQISINAENHLPPYYALCYIMKL